MDHGGCISEEMMLAYLEGKLNPSDQHRVEKHLLECDFCHDAFEGLSTRAPQQTKEALRGLDQQIENRIRSGGKTTNSFVLYRIAAVLLLFALFGGGIYYLRTIRKSEMIFTENFKPYRDTVATTPAAPSVAPVETNEKRNDEENVVAPARQLEQVFSGKEKNGAPSQTPVNDQMVTVTKNISGSAASPTQSDLTLAEKKNSVAAKDKDDESKETVATGSASRDLDAVNKKSERDESKADNSVSTNTPAPEAQREGSFKSIDSKRTRGDEKKQLNATAFSTTVSSKNSESPTDSLIKSGIKYYDEKNYPTATSVFKEVLTKEPQNNEALFYSGVSHLSLNEYGIAIKELEFVLKNTPNKFSDAAKWYLSLAYIKENKISKAKKLLQDLSAGNSEYKSNAAKALDELK